MVVVGFGTYIGFHIIFLLRVVTGRGCEMTGLEPASITCTIVRVHVSVHGDKLFSRGLKEKWTHVYFSIFRDTKGIFLRGVAPRAGCILFALSFSFIIFEKHSHTIFTISICFYVTLSNIIFASNVYGE